MPSAFASSAALPAYTGVYVFGDSLVDPGNDLRAADLIGGLPFVGVPDGAPTADKGYFEGRFTDGYNGADLVANKLLHEPTQPTFAFGIQDPLLGLTLPFLSKPNGVNLSFAYGGAMAIQPDSLPPDLHDQVGIYDNFTADPNALYLIVIGANDIRALVPTGGTMVTGAAADAQLSAIAGEITQEVSHLLARGARHVLVADIPDVGLTPEYAGSLDEAARRALASQYVQTADARLQADLANLAVPAGATVLDYDFQGYTHDVIANPAAHGFTNVTQARMDVQAGHLDPVGSGFLFFDEVHPSAQAHAQIAGEILDALRGDPVVDNLAPAIGPQAMTTVALGGTDSFTASLVGGRSYVIDVLGLSNGAGSLADPLLRVLDASGAVVAQDDDSGLGLDPHLHFTATASGEFTIQVSGVGVTSGGFRLQAGEANGANLLTSGDLEGSNETVTAGAGDDTVAALSGSNYLRGGDGNDSIQGGSGFDDINGNKGDDVIDGGSGGGDWLVGGQGNDLITAHAGQNILYGNLGNDTLHAGSGGELMRGGQGDDSITGGIGNDWISGDRGSDTMSGGAGADVFHSFSGAGLDVVLDFNAMQGDRVQLDPGTGYTASQMGADTVVDMGGGDELILRNVQLSSLPQGWIFTL
ncbi:MAG TPA: SGNH/GDSL hydrolase family protein [Phenylobacterium sp.]|uniref:SGNH/GDSL hydrolase family protein n=1 Tax=Phenylobacterium sp. TaxID=1871053 RepID=UPI002CDDB296|nr:SGNH/GDSL hydrolase family protein [Phenylobacterium sp.]HSV03480.1 SGNH/GDSL hydrolase family protein [Phenylobacterium sp.]